MKKTFTLLFYVLLAFSWQVNAQYFTEDFENGGNFPTGWTLSPGTGDDWAIDQGDEHGPGSAQSGTYCAFFNDYDYSSGTVAEMITPVFDLSAATAPELRFWYYDGGGSDTVEVLVSTDGTTFTSVYTTADTVTPWTEIVVDLSSYAGEATVTISWKGTSIFGLSNPHVDNITVAEPPACPAPSGLAASNISNDSADLSWTENGSATTWNIEYGPTGFTQGSGTVVAVTTNPYTLTGLTSNTSYDFYVQSDCGSGSVSVWSGPYTFSTNPVCGDTFYDDGGPNNNYSNNLNQTITLYPATAGDVVTVTFNSFDMEEGWDGMMVYNGPDSTYPIFDSGSTFGRPACPNGAWTGAPGDQYTADGHSFTSTDASGALTFVFTTDGSVSHPGWEAVVSCGPPPTCPAPMDLAASNITIDSADLSWTETGSATAWNIEYGPAGFTQGSGTVVAVTTNPYTLTGLTTNTTYDFYVQADCGGGDVSAWTGPESFTTLCDTQALPYTQTFDSDSDCWTVENTNGDSLTWTRATNTTAISCIADNTDYVMFVGYNSSQDMDDWLFSPGFNLTASNNYTIAFSYGNDGGSTYLENMDVYLTTAPNSADALNGIQIFTETGISDGCHDFNDTNITVPSDGVYYVAFHGNSPADQDILMVDDFSIDVTPGAVKELTNVTGIYPNPTTGEFVVKSHDLNNAEVFVYTLTGKEIYHGNIDSDNYTVNLANARKGVYFVKIISDDKSYVSRLIVK